MESQKSNVHALIMMTKCRVWWRARGTQQPKKICIYKYHRRPNNRLTDNNNSLTKKILLQLNERRRRRRNVAKVLHYWNIMDFYEVNSKVNKMRIVAYAASCKWEDMEYFFRVMNTFLLLVFFLLFTCVENGLELDLAIQSSI